MEEPAAASPREAGGLRREKQLTGTKMDLEWTSLSSSSSCEGFLGFELHCLQPPDHR